MADYEFSFPPLGVVPIDSSNFLKNPMHALDILNLFVYETNNSANSNRTLGIRPGGLKFPENNTGVLSIVYAINGKIFYSKSDGVYGYVTGALTKLYSCTEVLNYVQHTLLDGKLVLILLTKETAVEVELKPVGTPDVFTPKLFKNEANVNIVFQKMIYYETEGNKVNIVAISRSSNELWVSPNDGKIYESNWTPINFGRQGIAEPIRDIGLNNFDKQNGLIPSFVVVFDYISYSRIKLIRGDFVPSNTSAPLTKPQTSVGDFRLPKLICDNSIVEDKQQTLIITLEGYYSLASIANDLEAVLPTTGKNNILINERDTFVKYSYYIQLKNISCLDIYNKTSNTYKYTLIYQTDVGFLTISDMGYKDLGIYKGKDLFINRDTVYYLADESDVNFVLQSSHLDMGNSSTNKIMHFVTADITTSRGGKMGAKALPFNYENRKIEYYSSLTISYNDIVSIWDEAVWGEDRWSSATEIPRTRSVFSVRCLSSFVSVYLYGIVSSTNFIISQVMLNYTEGQPTTIGGRG